MVLAESCMAMWKAQRDTVVANKFPCVFLRFFFFKEKRTYCMGLNVLPKRVSMMCVWCLQATERGIL